MTNIRGAGYIEVLKELTDGKGARVLNDFLDRFCYWFARKAKNYIEVTQEASFAYRERQLHSVVAPALSEYTDAFLMELPIDRRWSRLKSKKMEDSHGWIDYWCLFRDYEFFLELKHGYVGYKTNYLRRGIAKQWKSACDQISAGRRDAKHISRASTGAFLLVMQVIPLYETADAAEESDFIFDSEEFRKKQKTYFDSLKPPPNWSALWVLNPKLSEKCLYEGEDEKNQCYPAVLFFARISKVLH